MKPQKIDIKRSLNYTISLITFLSMVVVGSFGFSEAAITDQQAYTPTDYYTFQPPAVNSSYVDPVFGTEILRVSDALSMEDSASGGNLTYIVNEYSTATPFNSDGTRLILQHNSYYGLYSGQGNYLSDLPFSISAGTEPRWSRTNPDLLYFINDNRLRSYNIATGSVSTVRTFSSFSQISGRGEQDISSDGDYFVLSGDDRYIFTYQISSNTVSSLLDTSGTGGFDNMYITPDNNVLVGWYDRGTNRFQGVELYDTNMNFIRHIAPALGHMDVTRDTDGSEVMIWANSADPTPICDNGVVKIRLSDAQETCLMTMDWSLALHVSAPNNAGHAIVSTYAPSDPDPSGSWPAYTNEVVQVMLDGSEVRRLAHHRSRPFNGYNYMPKASVSADGSKLVYSSNYGLQEISGAPTQYSDVYMIDSLLADSSNDSPTADFVVDCSQLDCSFDATTSDDPDGSLTTYSWQFGDGTSAEGISPDHTYPSTGDYTVSLTVTDDSGETDSTSDVVAVDDGSNSAPVASFTVSCSTLSCSFDASSSSDSDGTIVSYSWDFGDGSTGSGVTVSHTYDTSGSYQVQLVVEDDAGSVGSATESISVGSDTSESVRYEEDDSAIQYSGTWYTNDLSKHSDGGAFLAMNAGATASLTFYGQELQWIAYRDEWSGIAEIYLDGSYVDTVDTYASPSEAQAVMYSLTTSPDATHTVEIVVTGTQSEASDGAWIWLDAFDVLQ